MVEVSHHVAWKDRLGLNRVWEQCILRCVTSFGTPAFGGNVHLFHISLVNIRDGPQLKNLVDDYIDGDLKNWKTARYNEWVIVNKSDARIPELSNKTKDEIEMIANEFLYNYIIQTLEDNGFCFYQSKLEEDEIM